MSLPIGRLDLLSIVALVALHVGCGAAEINAGSDIDRDIQKSEDGTADDRADEKRASFVELPDESNSGPKASPTKSPVAVATPTPKISPTSPTDSTGKYGVGGNLSCDQYVAEFWKLGSMVYEEAPGPLFTKLKFTSKVLSVEGKTVTVNTKLETPDASANIDENLSFDACDAGHRIAVPTTQGACEEQALGNEDITVGGTLYHTKKVKFENCTTLEGKTYSTVIWRAPDLPLWGIVKREVSGTVVPSELNGKISAQTKSWLFD